MKVYEAIAEAIAAEGCRSIFGLMGDGNMLIWGALARNKDIAIYSARHEATAVGMADGHFRAMGEVTVATVTWGPGLTQATTPATVAARNGSSIVLVIGQVARESKDRTQYMDHKRFAELCGLVYREVTSADAAAQQIAEAFYVARALGKAVLLDVTMDVQLQELEWDFDYRPSTEFISARQPLEPDEAALRQIYEVLKASERPVLIAGRGARAAGAREEMLRLAEKAGALLGTTLPAKGYFSDQEFDLGIAGAFATAPGEKHYADADFILGFGAELGHFTTEGGLLFPEAQVARIDIKPAPDEIGPVPGLYARGDARLAARRLCEMFDEEDERRARYRTEETRTTLATPPPPHEKPDDGLDPRLVLQNLSKALPARARVVSGVGHYWGFVAMYLGIPASVQQIITYQFGSIAQAFHQALGAAASTDDRPTILIEGDGSLLCNIQEIGTAVRYNLPLVVLVMNDSAYGAEVHKLKVKGFEPELATWPEVDFVAIAKAFGGQGRTLKSEDEMAEALTEGLASKTLYLIDARVSPSTVTDTYRKIHFGLANQAPLLRAGMDARA